MFCVMNLEVIKKTAVRPRISWSCGSFNCFYVIYSANFKPASFASARMDALETFFPSYSTRSSVPPVKISVFAAFFRMMQSSWTVISRASFTSRFRLLLSSIGRVIRPSSSSFLITPVVFIMKYLLFCCTLRTPYRCDP